MKLLRMCAVFALVSCAYARTATRQPPVSAHITSLTDKDAKHKAMVHPAFANAGRQAGVEVWRIEDFEPVAVPAKDIGKFYKGDSYIVLKTKKDNRNNLSWDIHYWIGSESTQDESGAAAILTVGLDDKFGGAAVQHRETLGHESAQFTGYFQPAIRYLDGGHASGFHHVTTNAGAEKRLFQIKGKKNVRVRQVEPQIASMNKGDCFILDVNHDILVYVGDKASRFEKLKATSVANQIRDQDHNGRASVNIIDQFSNEVDVQKFFTSLGSGSRDLVPEDSAGGDDQTFERNEEATVTLSEISDSSGKLKITPLSKPYKQEQLKPEECYILDTVSGSIYVWVGKKSTEKEKNEAMSKAQQYLSAKSYPSWVHVARIPQGTEPAAFKQYFTTWKDVGMSHTRLVRSISDEELFSADEEVSDNRARNIAKTGAARGFMPDNGEGRYSVYRMEDNDKVLAYNSSNSGSEPGKRRGEFFQGDAYIVLYQGDDSSVIYHWLGKDSSSIEQAAAAMFSVQIDRQLSGKAAIVRVPQGEEPKHFLRIFKGRMVTLLGGKGSGFRNDNHEDSNDNDGIRLFRIYGTTASVDMRANQVPEKADSLQSDDVFLLQTPTKNYLWYGQDSSEVEQQEAVEFVARILGDEAKYDVVKQGEEPADFWSYLGGDASHVVRTEQWRLRMGKIVVTPRLFEATFKTDNTVAFEEIAHFKQSDLDPEDVYLLDDGQVMYLWIGGEATIRQRKGTTAIANAYQARHRNSTFIVIKQGLEPESFVRLFENWDPDMWQKQRTYEEEKEAALDFNEIDND